MDRREAARRYAKRWRQEKARGVQHSIPIEDVACHVDKLIAAGGSVTGIGEAAGVHWTIIGELSRRQRKRIHTATADRILRVAIPDLVYRSSGQVPSVGAIRRVRALLALGHSHATITSQLPTPNARFTMQLVSRQPLRVSRSMHDAVCVAYDDLSMTPGTSKVTRRRALREGYKPPLWWDEADLDDPYADTRAPLVDDGDGVEVVDWVAVRRRMEGDRTVRLTQDEARALLEEMYAHGYTTGEVQERTGLKPERYLPISEWRAAS